MIFFSKFFSDVLKRFLAFLEAEINLSTFDLDKLIILFTWETLASKSKGLLILQESSVFESSILSCIFSRMIEARFSSIGKITLIFLSLL